MRPLCSSTCVWLSSQVVFGHDAVRGLQQTEFTVGLDTGCCYGKALSALVLPERRIVQVRAHQMYASPNIPLHTAAVAPVAESNEENIHE
jgi:hypothetical protein